VQGGDPAALKRMPKREQLERAKERDIDVKASMSKDELVEALSAS
jgi:hypothetical protein